MVSSHFLDGADLWTHQPGPHRIYPPFFYDACFIFSREKDAVNELDVQNKWEENTHQTHTHNNSDVAT